MAAAVLVVVCLLAACGGVPVADAATGPAAPAPVSAPSARGRLVVHGTGDVNLDPSYIPALRASRFDPM